MIALFLVIFNEIQHEEKIPPLFNCLTLPKFENV